MSRLGNGLLTAAIAAAAYPWMTGAYTWVQQQRMLADLSAPKTTYRAPGNAAVPEDEPRLFAAEAMTGWTAEDRPRWQGLEDGEAFARLSIPAIDVDVVVVKGVAEADLKRGPGWLPDTALPGELGNVGISGHRTTYLAPFRRLDEVEPGDRIELRSETRRYVYRVERRFTVTPEDGHVMAPTSNAMLTLTTCHPPFRDTQRMVVQATLQRVVREGDGDSDQGE